MCIVSAAVTELRDIKMSAGWGFMSWILDLCLLLQLKVWGVRGASHQLAFMSNHQTISHMFYIPIYPVDERKQDVGLV